uniref:Uncharacterized protein n=1 Tax=Angiostrongylus cantonensis TaxID=6313 RepID=A0A0K0CTU6_ANGCA
MRTFEFDVSQCCRTKGTCSCHHTNSSVTDSSTLNQEIGTSGAMRMGCLDSGRISTSSEERRLLDGTSHGLSNRMASIWTHRTIKSQFGTGIFLLSSHMRWTS